LENVCARIIEHMWHLEPYLSLTKIIISSLTAMSGGSVYYQNAQ
jgi:hypothetical protein